MLRLENAVIVCFGKGLVCDNGEDLQGLKNNYILMECNLPPEIRDYFSRLLHLVPEKGSTDDQP